MHSRPLIAQAFGACALGEETADQTDSQASVCNWRLGALRAVVVPLIIFLSMNDYQRTIRGQQKMGLKRTGHFLTKSVAWHTDALSFVCWPHRKSLYPIALMHISVCLRRTQRLPTSPPGEDFLPGRQEDGVLFSSHPLKNLGSLVISDVYRGGAGPDER
jgi:hypothetical protein